jgi:DNA-binding CsgD family transcriptional regulator
MTTGAERRLGADRYEQVVDLVFAISGGDLRSALRALVIANEYLKLELAAAYSAVSHDEALSLAETYQTVFDQELKIGSLSGNPTDNGQTGPPSEPSLRGEDNMVGDSEVRPGPRQMPADVALLSPRERTILDLIGQGQSNKEIARGLGITPETVKSHVKKIFIKLKVDKRFAAVALAAAQ